MTAEFKQIFCPRCDGELTLPAELQADDLVRCPLCNQEYPADELPAFAPPKLVIVQRKGQSLEHTATAGSQPDVPEHSRSREIQFAGVNTKPGFTASEPVSLKRRRYFSHRKLSKGRDTDTFKNKSRRSRRGFRAMDFVKIIVGALLALPVAQLILWWGLNRDPFDMGKSVSRYLPFAVPLHFRELPTITESEPPAAKRESSNLKISNSKLGIVKPPTDDLDQ